MAGAYARGSMAWGDCKKCGLRFLLRDLVFDGYYPGLRVCAECYDDKHPQEQLIDVGDPVALWKPSPDQYKIQTPVLTATPVGVTIQLNWTSIGFDPRKHAVAEVSKGYQVFRSSDGVSYSIIATLLNTADEFGALSVETLTYTDTPATGTWYYYVEGYDVLDGVTHG